MALKYEINMFETDPNDASKTFVTLVVTTEDEKSFAISKSITTGSNTDAQIIKAAQTEAQSEIDTWVSQVSNIGKTWNPETEKIE
tara:strand:+ start:508 stop:762 length:255 start_codon:yes stop_codon:yes gene_type:complete